MLSVNTWVEIWCLNYGMMRAPKRAMASEVAPFRFNLGTNIPVRISFGLGLACISTAKKQPPTIITSIPMTTSSFLI